MVNLVWQGLLVIDQVIHWSNAAEGFAAFNIALTNIFQGFAKWINFWAEL